ncbi:hypothetical protein HL658_23765 [Azospirillum sp. RWY-5-1]|uniref:Gamma-glutamyltransferase n=1 Tax=Azospirillum oleiclasticum TaxID=2735135 RepID=A0ABX2TE20_9PROT|nr:gamma-glutamyltransferase [Azospirillum oleiclasticum]NYZ15569.1 hypothetical protein [Azospirillum oleiclasticum]NYZ22592.1 hypothetical protein [Azospirillum oleiclasticum]
MTRQPGGEAAVTGSCAAAVDAGTEILRAGGNAVDAAVATALAACVADPCNTGIGGYGGHMVVLTPEGEGWCVDFNTFAPPGVPDDHLRTVESRTGPAVSTMPCVVAGLAAALTRFGRLDWARVSTPAIQAAETGVEANPTTRAAFAQVRGRNFVGETFVLEEEGDRLVFRQPALAATLRRMAEDGPGWFYDGPLAGRAAESWRSAGLSLDPADWRAVPDAVRIAPAPRLRIADADVWSGPLGTSGSLCLFGILAAAADIGRDLRRPEGLARLAGAMAAVWSHRFGPSGGNAVDPAGLPDWIRRALSGMPGSGPRPGDVGHTCHLNTLDHDGTMVAMTLTHGPFWFGGRWVLPGTGVVMNAGMPLFRWADPVHRGGRRFAVTNLAPTLVRCDDGTRCAAGTPGARRIPGIVATTLARALWGGFTLPDAVSAGRLHAESRDAATLERTRHEPAVEAAFAGRFRSVGTEEWTQYYGPLTAIRRGADGAAELGLDDREGPGFGRVLGR